LDRQLRDSGDVRELNTAKVFKVSKLFGMLQDQGGRGFVGTILG